MKIRNIMALIVTLSLFLGAPAFAKETVRYGFDEPRFTALYDDIVNWLGINTRYSIKEVGHPEMRFVDKEFLKNMICRDKGIETSECTLNVRAAYDKGVMWVGLGFDPMLVEEDKITFVHELVHHLQEQSPTKVSFACMQHIEHEAYKTELLYAKEFGLNDETNPIFVKLLSLPCRSPIDK
ncbi:MAG: hypothetical protein A2845_02195 [Candidatus Lloydbacteria bacterium RIFCSPHIGHO2_01_FULL_49_22]|uniref:DUF4157 domain-containing protein n=1 Tax=Candidatus Lloydbacteria bacterium RIFCSPHIGHO2_01_FULL_49_22 TaxID=1798658 RepID=A0A1G2CWU2_9BACT|nr:MAG: hypothetical protein A2845_02195 [Candidatus Lloydbacteria bacterium RIFCSPHIGHO2_01_FULL_49_22]OGZ10263.1 MAG: hypothetical protein A3C14_01895 [Candidatus Lloydbacteria bacterium RIFCSPHIGHO2_02_FULL_50_18]